MKLINAKLLTFLTIVCIYIGAPGNGLCQEGSALEQAMVMEAVPATYPPIAVVGRVAGTVTVRVKIISSGRVESVLVVTGPKLLHKVAKTAAAKWVFNNSNNKNEPLRTVDLHFIFVILPEGATSEELLPTFLPPFSVKIKEGLGRIDSGNK